MSEATVGALGGRAQSPLERIRLSWPVPTRIYLQYLLKFALYVCGWALCCAFSRPTDPGAAWYVQPDAFKKFALYSLLFEGLGLGCSSGPLSGSGANWFTPHRHFLTPGTIKLPFIAGLPIFGSHRRSWFDVALYVAGVALLVRALLAPHVLGLEHVLPIVIVSLLLGLSDRTQFLCMRPEQYLYMAICFLFPGDWLAGAKWVQFAIWMGAGISKLNHIFPYVTLVLAVSHPLLSRFPGIKAAMIRAPSDLRPSPLCRRITHVATAVEAGFPIVLLLSDGGWPTALALVVMTLFHLNIITSMPWSVPIEWNIFVLYSMWFLFGYHAAAPVSVSSPWLLGLLVFGLVGLPLLGNFVPARTSFLIAMRYYAGNWAFSSWMFRGDAALAKLGRAPHAPAPFELGPAPLPPVQYLQPDPVTMQLHLLARAVLLLWPRAVGGREHLPAYKALTGDTVSRRMIGWNFGDGHLHDERLLRVVQTHCQFEPGELVHIFVESQPLHRQSLAYRITDAATGQIERGEIPMSEMLKLQPHSVADARLP